MTDKLEQMFELAKSFSGHWVDFDNITDVERQEAGRQYILDAYSELDELRKTFDDKTWRRTPDNNKIAEEAGDVLAYVLSTCLTFGIGAEVLIEAYKNKMKLNEEDFKRRQNGR